MDVTHVDVKIQLSKKQIFATGNDLVVKKSSLAGGHSRLYTNMLRFLVSKKLILDSLSVRD